MLCAGCNDTIIICDISVPGVGFPCTGLDGVCKWFLEELIQWKARGYLIRLLLNGLCCSMR